MKSINLTGLRDRKRVLALLNEGKPFAILERKKVIAHFIPRKPPAEVPIVCEESKNIPAAKPEVPGPTTRG